VRLGTADPAQTVEVTLTIRGKRELPELNASVSPIPIEEIESEYGSEQEDFDLVENVLGKFGLTITGQHLGARTMEAKGTIKQMDEAFDVTLSRYRSPKQGEYLE
jgi:hypothetical protein